jgi:hypothetical protein
MRPFPALDSGYRRILVMVMLLSGCDHTASFLRPKTMEAAPSSPDVPQQTNATDTGAVPEPGTPATIDNAADAAQQVRATNATASQQPSAPASESTLPPPRVEEPSGNAALPLPTPPPAEPSLPVATPPLPPGSVASDPSYTVWGIVGLRGFPYGQATASNGVEYNPLFSADLDFNIWLWRAKRIYGYSDMHFWGQKATPGVTNPHQGSLDFSKREFDFVDGLAWNYYGKWEFRAFGYSFNNLNRGTSLTIPTGFNDGVGIENRYYLNPNYATLGTPAFDKARATFLSIGYYPSKSMVDSAGISFTPGAFARAYLIWELYGPKLYLFTDDTIITNSSFQATLFITDSGIAYRPFNNFPRWEFRLGSQDSIDMLNTDAETTVYLSGRYIF